MRTDFWIRGTPVPTARMAWRATVNSGMLGICDVPATGWVPKIY